MKTELFINSQHFRSSHYKSFLSVMLLLMFLSLSINAQEKLNSSNPQVEIAGTQLLKINSKIIGEEFNLYVNLPRFINDLNKTFPVLFLLDAQWDFPLVQSIYGEQYYDGFLPEIITVGITWGGVNPNADQLRRRDFTPRKINNDPFSGNAAIFLKFIKEELIPFIDSRFNTDKTDHALMGSSLGGLFTLYAMFNETNLFKRYILTSPALQWDNKVIYEYEKEFAAKNKSLPASLYMAIGDYEDEKGFQNFADLISSKNYKNLKMKTRVLETTGHSASKAEGYSRGIQFVYEKPEYKVDQEIMNLFVGDYQIMPGVKLNVSIEDGHLIALTPEGNKMKLYAVSDTEFYAKGIFLRAKFQVDSNGNVEGMLVKFYNGEQFVTKIKQ